MKETIHDFIIWPLILIAITSMSVGKTLVFGKRTKFYHIGYIGICSIFNVTMLYLSGFFLQWNWPQLTWFVLTFMGIANILCKMDWDDYTYKDEGCGIFVHLFFATIIYFIYYNGGVFHAFH